MKLCKGCGRHKPLEDFYPHPQTADGRSGKCRPCTRAAVAANRAARREQYSTYERARAQRPERKASAAVYQRRIDRQKKRARTAVNNALKAGKLTRGICEVCGDPNTEGHHDDYSKPLEVRWLCFRHHRAEHGQVVVEIVPRTS